ncbi:toll/interleukin-1 receptor domain-containing protein [candidate division KSB1 bacterium]|nr:toll/interleukin-1 receptor domain-containing protein [candidate division KSB1 bacterium]
MYDSIQPVGKLTIDEAMEDTQKKYLVFISHSHIDSWVAKQIASKLEAEGVETFLDQLHITVGDDFEAQIVAALKQADELLVLFTPWSQTSRFVWMEIGAALVRGIPIVPVVHGLNVDDLISQPGFPVTLKKRGMISLNQIEGYFSQLKSRISTRS